KNLIDSYIDEFNPESYDVITKQSFDSTKKHEFIRLYFKTHKERKEALNYLKKK
ncbi:9795_t:CDS:1, partial [Gigaspora margarita]